MIPPNVLVSPRSNTLLDILHPRGQERRFAIALATGLLIAWLSVTRLNLPLWAAAIALLLPAAHAGLNRQSNG